MNPTTLARGAALACVLALGFASAAPSCRADVVKLKTGETIKGRVVRERTNELVLVIEDYGGGGVREIAWDAVEDEETITSTLGILRGSKGKEQSIPCEAISYRLDDGSVTELRGKVEGEEGGYLLVKTRAQEKPLRIEKSRVVQREQTDCDPDQIYEPTQLFRTRKDEMNPQEAKDWFALGVYGEQVGAFADAKEAYETAAADETYLQRELAKAGAARMTALLNDKEALDAISDLKNLLAFAAFQKVREGIDSFPAKHPAASEAVLKQLETLKSSFAQARTTFFSRRAMRDLMNVLRASIQKHVAPRDAAYNDVQSWARKPALEEAFAELTKQFQQKDPVVTAEETKTFFDARPKRASDWRYAKYGAGSFLIEPPKIKPPTGNRNRPPPTKSGSKGSGPAPNITIPPPPTRDTWWQAEPAEGRAQFWLAQIVEKSGVFDLAPQRDRTPCPKCNGEGVIHKLTSNGQDLAYLCDRCGGAQNDLTVKFR